MTGTAVVTTVDSSKNTTRPHQILSRETSFISKPVSTEEKHETTTTVPSTITTVQVTTTPQIMNSPVTATSTIASSVSITSKFYQTNEC